MVQGAVRWGVVATVDEPAALLAAFVAHYLALGAAEVRLYLDRPDPEAEALLDGVPGVILTRCDAAWWAASPAGARPPRHTARQLLNASHAGRVSQLDWLLHCDADEFLYCEGRVAAELATTPEHYDAIKIPPLERTYLPGTAPPAHVFTGAFRVPRLFTPEEEAAIYGPTARYLGRGVAAHVIGKSVTRLGRGHMIGVHDPRPATDTAPDPRKTRAETMLLLHYDGLTPLHYAIKLMLRATEPAGPEQKRHGAARRAQIRRMAEVCTDAEQARHLQRSVQGVTPRQAAILQQRGGLVSPNPGIARSVAALFGGRVSLRAEDFDAALRRRHADLIARTGLALP